MLTGPTYLSLPSSPFVFVQLSSVPFPYYLEAWNRLFVTQPGRLSIKQNL